MWGVVRNRRAHERRGRTPSNVARGNSQPPGADNRAAAPPLAVGAEAQ